MNVSIPIAIPEDYTATERQILGCAFQDLVDTFAQLRREGVSNGRARELALQFAVDEQLILRGAHIDWTTRRHVGKR